MRVCLMAVAVVCTREYCCSCDDQFITDRLYGLKKGVSSRTSLFFALIIPVDKHNPQIDGQLDYRHQNACSELNPVAIALFIG